MFTRLSHSRQQFKSGATSIYAVVIATLLFSVITVSFIRIIVSEANRTASDELSQMAYDAALAGVEDAKAAIKRYLYCKNNPTATGCSTVLATSMAADNCDSVSQILYGGATGEVKLSENASSTSEETTNQAYTCVMLSNESNNYRSTLSSENPIRMVPLRTPSSVSPSDVAKLRISWHSRDNGTDLNFRNSAGGFNKITGSNYASPATLSATVIQTGGGSFDINSFDGVSGSSTNRAMAFLVPQATNAGSTSVSRNTLVNSNQHTTDGGYDTLLSTETLAKNSPQNIKCDGFTAGINRDYACQATLELPDPIGGARNHDTFYLVVSLPYENPETEFTVEMLKADGSIISFSGVQYVVDATGRANDMYSRVEARLEPSSSHTSS